MPSRLIPASVILLGATILASAQDSSTAPKADCAPLKVCSAKNPPPCATAPKPIFAPNPEYSEKARKKKFQGNVILETVVGTDGHTRDIRVIQPLAYGLSDKAIQALRDWKFEPGTQDGKPVPVLLEIEMSFRLY